MLDATTLPITFENTRLRPLSELDADAYAAGTKDEAVRRFGHLPESDYTPESVRRMIRDEVAEGLSCGTLAVLALADAETDRFVGSLVLFDVSSEAAEVGFWIHPDARGAGHARRGLELASRFARNSGLRSLTARTLLENKASKRCLTNAGFHEVERAVGTTPAGQREELFHYRRDLKPTAQWPLATERLRLRPHNADDAEWLHELYSRPDVARYLLDEPWTAEVTHDKLTERLAKTDIDGETGALALVIEHDGVPIGDVALWLTDHEHRQGEIGWVLDPAHGGQGFASEAVRAVLALGFDHYRLHRITAQMDARNSASAALARRVGLRLEAHHVQDWFSKGEWTDTLIFARLASEHMRQ
ncbi:GNAT family N-acetyltransferase [Kytococcus sedentarius]|uniref:Acetyltransferase, ribosomal protein N-acetylase n=1 Tax=Kytococcus sedentarius (strain ATCC 14392 / DSM 20547 / JCM 11482 / CCUG 33030 / NBRC 15357 / NCTC 11040 / CCM 314 / 541) TaxID=478801 RepID=C7NJA4_KYTSD|nr:GNAT family N-acetyltransferase [Kytococcus sedentarius]ACV06791.1 acetyltransferase, ribosomal protein N-acetylase [Kytococcus sedentarius DSM 20547]QQB62822.1 GNAT family N-acetyltransferase [Kytococcus sedentarius]STX14389.1 Spermidine N(1)-acetyltransferase [Kytococcus sedentarius]